MSELVRRLVSQALAEPRPEVITISDEDVNEVSRSFARGDVSPERAAEFIRADKSVVCGVPLRVTK